VANIVLIGAGSFKFARDIITDILLYPELRDNTITLMDIDNEAFGSHDGVRQKNDQTTWF